MNMKVNRFKFSEKNVNLAYYLKILKISTVLRSVQDH